jgi:hypothetical protein
VKTGTAVGVGATGRLLLSLHPQANTATEHHTNNWRMTASLCSKRETIASRTLAGSEMTWTASLYTPKRGLDVTADSLFEAAAMALAVFKKDGWTDPVGSAARLEVQVKEPAVTHTVRASDSAMAPGGDSESK